MFFEISDTEVILIFIGIVLVWLVLTFLAIRRLVKNPALAPWIRLLWILSFLVWPILAPGVYLLVSQKRKTNATQSQA